MNLKFNVPDHVYEAYVLKYGVSGAYARMRRVLDEMKTVDEADRYVLLHGDERRAVEAVFQTTIESGAKLAKLLARLNAVSIEGTTMSFTTDELEQLQQQALFHNRTLEVFIDEMVKEIKGFMMERI